MDLKQLTALVVVAEVGSVTRAARLLHLVQPAVTRQIRLLEEELDVTLFERTRQGMVATPVGERLVERARRVLGELERARAEIRAETAELSGIATVGVLESVMDLVVEPLVGAVAGRLPGVDLRILTAYSGHLQQWLDVGDVDMSLLYNLTDSPSLSVVSLLDEALWAVAPPAAGLDPDEPVPMAGLLLHPLVLPVAGHGLRILFEQARSGLDVAPQIAIETNSMHLQKRLVLAGYGWTILPAAGVSADVTAGVLSAAPLSEPDVTRSLVLALRRGSRPSRAVEAVAAELARIVRARVGSGEWPSARLRPVPP